jgi:hypothetical protein
LHVFLERNRRLVKFYVGSELKEPPVYRALITMYSGTQLLLSAKDGKNPFNSSDT